MTAAVLVLVGLVSDDPVVLRNQPSDEAPAQAELHRGDWLEVRQEIAGFFKVWDHRHERPGYVRTAQVRVYPQDESAADALATVVLFLRDSRGSESLGIGHAALYVKVASPPRLSGPQGAQVLEALGTMADRLGRRLSRRTGTGPEADRSLAAQLAVAESYGLNFASVEEDGKTRLCYDGDAFFRLLSLPSSSARLRADAILALTREACGGRDWTPVEKRGFNQRRERLLKQATFEQLPDYVGHRLHLRAAEIATAQAWDLYRQGNSGAAREQQQAAARALGAVDEGTLAPEDRPWYETVAVRVGAGRFMGADDPLARDPLIKVVPGKNPGESCAKIAATAAAPAAERCGFGLIWTASARRSASRDTIVVSVGTTEAWTELWIFRRKAGAWTTDTIVPALGTAGIDPGYVELAGFAPDGDLLVARDARTGGQRVRRFELLANATGAVKKGASRPQLLLSFQRFASPSWRAESYSVR